MSSFLGKPQRRNSRNSLVDLQGGVLNSDRFPTSRTKGSRNLQVTSYTHYDRYNLSGIRLHK